MGRSRQGHQATAHLDSPQGFKNSPAIFGEALASDLNSFHPEEYGCWLLQYVDDLLLAAETKEECWKGIKALLQLLMEAGYQACMLSPFSLVQLFVTLWTTAC